MEQRRSLVLVEKTADVLCEPLHLLKLILGEWRWGEDRSRFLNL